MTPQEARRLRGRCVRLRLQLPGAPPMPEEEAFEVELGEVVKGRAIPPAKGAVFCVQVRHRIGTTTGGWGLLRLQDVYAYEEGWAA